MVERLCGSHRLLIVSTGLMSMRDLVRNYFVLLGNKLSPRGGFVVQFLDESNVDYANTDASDESGGEPSISWSSWQLVGLAREANLTFVEIRKQLVTEAALWHWIYFRKDVSRGLSSID